MSLSCIGLNAEIVELELVSVEEDGLSDKRQDLPASGIEARFAYGGTKSPKL